MTEDQALALALNHAGLTEEQVTRLRMEKDIDRGVTLYEIDFDHGGYEYEYEIRTSDGKILKQELDRDD
ncbi:MAG: PepSY domain-containing protein [Clostridia bacterium]|nr:PepSY domain-containing protein [Clostridia bacterium]